MDGEPPLTAPSNLLNARRLYKLSTALLVDWLAEHGAARAGTAGAKAGIRREVTVKDIGTYADRISKRKLTAPQYVQNAFRTALINRRRMTAWYRANEPGNGGDDSETSRHEYFTDTLTGAYDKLFPGKTEPSIAMLDELAPRNPTVSNNFGLLEDAPTEQPNKFSEKELQSFLDEWADSSLQNRSAIKDDPFDDIYGLYIYVLEMDYMATVVKTYWDQAAEGTMPVALAAWLTTAGFAAISNICETYQNKKARMQIKTGQDLSEAEVKRSGHVTMYKAFSAGTGLMYPISALTEFSGNITDGRIGEGHAFVNIAKEKPTDFIISPNQERVEQLAFQTQICMTISDPRKLDLPQHEASKVLAMARKQADRDNKAMAALMRGIVQVFAYACAEQDRDDGQPDLTELGYANPLLVESTKYLQQSGDGIPRTELVFGLQMLLTTGKSFFWKSEKPNPTNIRLKALQLANEIKQTVWRIVEKEGNAGIYRNVQVNTFYALQHFHKELEVFTRTARFDLYYQMPWVAGMQISELLHDAIEFGVGLCRTRDIFGQMLHVYNLARQLAPGKTQKSELLEQLCDLFIDQVFLGERPKKNFHNILLRFMGGELESNAKNSKKGKKQREGKYHIGAPKSLADGAEDNKRLKAHQWSLFHDLRSTVPAFRGGGGFWAKVFTEKRTSTATPRQTEGMEQKIRDMPFALTLERVKDVVMSEFTGPFPVAKVNFFNMYEFACEVLSEIVGRYQQKLPVELRHYQELGLLQPAPADACAGASFVNAIMQDVDIKMEHARPGTAASLEAHSGLKLVGSAFNKCLSGKSVENFLWKHA